MMILLRRFFSISTVGNTKFQHKFKNWNDFDSKSLCEININNMIASNAGGDSTLASILEILCTQNKADKLDENIKIELHGNNGIYLCTRNSKYLPELPKVEFQPVAVVSEPEGSVTISTEFENTMNKILVSMNLTNERNYRNFIEQLMLEAIFGYSVSKGEKESFQANAIKNSIVGIHSDFRHIYPSIGTSLEVMRSVYRFPYATTPLFNIKKKYIGSDLNSRITCLFVTCEPGEKLKRDNVQKLLESRLYAINQVLNSSTFEKRIETEKDPIEATMPFRPVNVVITDGIRWSFSRFYRDLSNLETVDPTIGFSNADLNTLERLYHQEPLGMIPEFNLISDKIICKYHNDVYSIANDEIGKIISILRWWIRGFNVYQQKTNK